ncbi:hypothetical protein VNO78_06533 [Psophocarpus tetragonolobus]|uniref:Uncharacterized protein n=1 Tax=Psophocarpus tetragonolobus TaxID=3891 RepID=A0AAN9STC1_PSOTE
MDVVDSAFVCVCGNLSHVTGITSAYSTLVHMIVTVFMDILAVFLMWCSQERVYHRLLGADALCASGDCVNCRLCALV